MANGGREKKIQQVVVAKDLNWFSKKPEQFPAIHHFYSTSGALYQVAGTYVPLIKGWREPESHSIADC